MIILFKYYADVKNCKSFRGFSYIYIYRERLVNFCDITCMQLINLFFLINNFSFEKEL